MKAVILEMKDGYAAILKEDGTFARIPGKGNVGDTIEIADVIPFENRNKPKTTGSGSRSLNHRKIARIIVIAAAAVLVILGSGGYYLTTDAAASVFVDTGGTAVTLELNHFNRVIGIKAEDEEAEKLLDSLQQEDIRNHTLAEALDTVDAVMRENGYATDSEKPEVKIYTGNERSYDTLREQVELFGYPVTRAEDANMVPEMRQENKDRINETKMDEAEPPMEQGEERTPEFQNPAEKRDEPLDLQETGTMPETGPAQNPSDTLPAEMNPQENGSAENNITENGFAGNQPAVNAFAENAPAEPAGEPGGSEELPGDPFQEEPGMSQGGQNEMPMR